MWKNLDTIYAKIFTIDQVSSTSNSKETPLANYRKKEKLDKIGKTSNNY